MKQQDTILSDLFLNTAVRFENVPANSRMCICPWLDDNPTAKEGFVAAFKPVNRDVGQRWFDVGCGIGMYTNQECESIKSHRIMALLLMYELAKDYEEKLQNSEIA